MKNSSDVKQWKDIASIGIAIDGLKWAHSINHSRTSKFPLLEEVCYKQPGVSTADKTDVDHNWQKINSLAEANFLVFHCLDGVSNHLIGCYIQNNQSDVHVSSENSYSAVQNRSLKGSNNRCWKLSFSSILDKFIGIDPEAPTIYIIY